MAVEFVKCRRVDDRAVTADIAVSALPHLTGWERIPEEELRAEREAAEAARLSEVAGVEVTKQPPAPPAPERAAEPAPEPAPKPAPEPESAKKSRSRAANDK